MPHLFDHEADILVAGAGAAGQVCAIALAQAGFLVLLAGPDETPGPGRTVALLDGSIRFLAGLGLWAGLAPKAQPLATMRLVDDTGSLFALPPVEFHAAEIGLVAFGQNVANADLLAALAAAGAATPGLTRLKGRLADLSLGDGHVAARCGTGESVRARLAVGADGRRSLVRGAARIGIQAWTYPQTALTALVAHQRPHHAASTEFHTRDGPCTLVPLPSGADGRARSSLVWMTRPARADALAALPDRDFALAAERQTHSLLGALDIVGGRGKIAMSGLRSLGMTGPRTALAGEAAHGFPPIGAQGLNLSLRDAAALASALAGARDPGEPARLAAYARARRGDVAATIAGVDLLNSSLLAAFPPVDLLRGAGLAALAGIGPLRRMAMRAGLGQR